MHPDPLPSSLRGDGNVASSIHESTYAQATPFRASDFRLPPFRPAGSEGFAARYVALAALVLVYATSLGAATMATRDMNGSPLVGVSLLACVASIAVYCGAVGTWIYQSWAFLPPDMRRMANGRVVTPGQALGLLLVPLYNLYWFFAQSLGLCEAVDAALVQSGKAPSAPRNLALAASIAQVIPYINWLVGPVLWMTYMFAVDRAKARLLEG